MLRLLVVILTAFALLPAANAGDYVKANLTELHKAVFKNQAKAVEFYIQNGADINALAGNNNTPLHVAAFKGQTESVIMLLRYGADHAIKNLQGYTALDLATAQGYKEIISLLKNVP